MMKEMTHKSNQCPISKKEWKNKQDEIYNPEEDYFDVRKQTQTKYSYKPRFNKENPY